MECDMHWNQVSVPSENNHTIRVYVLTGEYRKYLWDLSNLEETLLSAYSRLICFSVDATTDHQALMWHLLSLHVELVMKCYMYWEQVSVSG